MLGSIIFYERENRFLRSSLCTAL